MKTWCSEFRRKKDKDGQNKAEIKNDGAYKGHPKMDSHNANVQSQNVQEVPTSSYDQRQLQVGTAIAKQL